MATTEEKLAQLRQLEQQAASLRNDPEVVAEAKALKEERESEHRAHAEAYFDARERVQTASFEMGYAQAIAENVPDVGRKVTTSGYPDLAEAHNIEGRFGEHVAAGRRAAFDELGIEPATDEEE